MPPSSLKTIPILTVVTAILNSLKDLISFSHCPTTLAKNVFPFESEYSS